jgi:uncharacterized protein (DUF2252 family)
MKSLEQRITEFHSDRNQPTLDLKYKLMAENEFTFFRATCHLFYEDLHHEPSLAQGPLVWACGDLHLENFGSYRAFNGLTYFDINDFDEAVLTPVSWELMRFLCSIGMASDLWKYSSQEAETLMILVLKEYTQQLAGGKAYAIEKETSPPLIQEFFEMAERRKEKEMIKSRINKKKEKLKIIENKTFALPKELYLEVKTSLTEYLKEHYGFLKIRDIVFRVAGTGSLGIKRYAILVEDARENKWRLLDLKQAYPSSLSPYLAIPQPKWASEAERITVVQSLMQYALPRFMGTPSINGKDFVLKQLQPTAQKIDHTLCHKKMKNVETVMATMAQAVASAQLRSASRKGSGGVDELIKFSLNSFWQNNLIQSALNYTQVMKKYFKQYRELYRVGKIRV